MQVTFASLDPFLSARRVPQRRVQPQFGAFPYRVIADEADLSQRPPFQFSLFNFEESSGIDLEPNPHVEDDRDLLIAEATANNDPIAAYTLARAYETGTMKPPLSRPSILASERVRNNWAQPWFEFAAANDSTGRAHYYAGQFYLRRAGFTDISSVKNPDGLDDLSVNTWYWPGCWFRKHYLKKALAHFTAITGKHAQPLRDLYPNALPAAGGYELADADNWYHALRQTRLLRSFSSGGQSANEEAA